MHRLNSSDTLINEQFYFRGAVSHTDLLMKCYIHTIIKAMYVELSVILPRHLNQ
jgi:hypothetical protein